MLGCHAAYDGARAWRISHGFYSASLASLAVRTQVAIYLGRACASWGRRRSYAHTRALLGREGRVCGLSSLRLLLHECCIASASTLPILHCMPFSAALNEYTSLRLCCNCCSDARLQAFSMCISCCHPPVDIPRPTNTRFSLRNFYSHPLTLRPASQTANHHCAPPFAPHQLIPLRASFVVCRYATLSGAHFSSPSYTSARV